MQDGQQQHRNWLGEIECPGRLLQDCLGITYVGAHVSARALPAAGQQQFREAEVEPSIRTLTVRGLTTPSTIAQPNSGGRPKRTLIHSLAYSIEA
jgi:hypothetical protein